MGYELKIHSWGKHSNGVEPDNKQTWDFAFVHDYRAKLREMIGYYNVRASRFVCYLNGEEVYNSQYPTGR